MTTTLISGANRGLGLATARALAAAGHTVFLGARDLDRARVAAEDVGATGVQLDVTDARSVEGALRRVEAGGGGLDVLVNNAGTTGSQRGSGSPSAEEAEQVFATNVIGVVRLTHAALPLLRRSAAGRIVNVGSGMGSFALTSDPERIESSGVVPVYSASKAALHMLTAQYAKAFPDLEINVVDPGYTATDMTAGQGQPLQLGVEAIVRIALHGAGATGTLLDRDGSVPW